jgi:photosystem II stability/assembly factor-like uncharacterized protein
VNNKRPIFTRYPDLLARQDDPVLLNLVEDLDALYTSHQLPTRLKLPVEANQFAASQQSQPETPRSGQPGTLSSVPRRHPRWSRLNTLAAVLSTFLLVSALAGTFYLARRGTHIGQKYGGSTPVSHNTQTGKTPLTITPVSPSALQEPVGEIHMMNASEGWARTWLAGNSNTRDELLHTSDGGLHWQNVTPAQYRLSPIAGGNISYISGMAAWAEVTNEAGAIVFVRTTDGGKTWQASAPLNQPLGMVPSNYAATNINYVTFLTPDTGWLLVATYNDLETTVGEVLYHTTDGGLTWHELTSSTSANANIAGRLPLPGAYTGLTFINPSTGWIMGSNVNLSGALADGGRPEIRQPWLYVTHDGGRTWHAQMLPDTSSIQGSGAGIVTYPPQFFSASDGLLTVSSWGPGEVATSVYATHDGGVSWQRNGFFTVFLARNSPGTTMLEMPRLTTTFASMNAGAFWEDSGYQDANTLAITQDGGRTWTQTRLSLPASVENVATSGQIEFVSAQTGWLLLSPTGKYPPFAPLLLKTLDGGQTWAQVHYRVS